MMDRSRRKVILPSKARSQEGNRTQDKEMSRSSQLARLFIPIILVGRKTVLDRVRLEEGASGAIGIVGSKRVRIRIVRPNHAL